jgi:CHASE3 domain sensor protein
MESSDKILIRLRLAASLRAILAKNKDTVANNEINGTENVSLIDSIRQLEASSRLSYTIVQGVFSAERDIQFTSLMSIIEEGFGLSLSEFSKIYDSMSDEDLKRTKKEIASSKRKKSTKQKGK